MKSFTEKVIEIVKEIPKGKVLKYSQVAEKAGNKKASRAVGTIMRNNKVPQIPCHRVVKSDGNVCGYNGINAKNLINKEKLDFVEAKMELLKEEGILFTENGKVIFS
jgi:O-6-methylguanine DNA methyltransferase